MLDCMTFCHKSIVVGGVTKVRSRNFVAPSSFSVSKHEKCPKKKKPGESNPGLGSKMNLSETFYYGIFYHE